MASEQLLVKLAIYETAKRKTTNYRKNGKILLLINQILLIKYFYYE